jgi:hypothetical protein
MMPGGKYLLKTWGMFIFFMYLSFYGDYSMGIPVVQGSTAISTFQIKRFISAEGS